MLQQSQWISSLIAQNLIISLFLTSDTIQYKMGGTPQTMTPGSRFIPYCIPATPTYGRHVPMEGKSENDCT